MNWDIRTFPFDQWCFEHYSFIPYQIICNPFNLEDLGTGEYTIPINLNRIMPYKLLHWMGRDKMKCFTLKTLDFLFYYNT